jgi:hypothetical protein
VVHLRARGAAEVLRGLVEQSRIGLRGFSGMVARGKASLTRMRAFESRFSLGMELRSIS